MSIQLLRNRHWIRPILPCYKGNNKYHRFPKPGGRSANKCRPVNVLPLAQCVTPCSPVEQPYSTVRYVPGATPGREPYSAPTPKPYNSAGGTVTGAPGVGGRVKMDKWA